MQRILILSNDSFMLWKFRRELIRTMLVSSMEVVIGVPAGAHTEDLAAMGCRLIDIPMEVFDVTPVHDWNLYRRYQQILKDEKPDMVVTYGANANICGGLACRRLRVPHCANVQGLGNLFQTPVKSRISTLMCRMALKKAKTVFFENSGNAALFRERKIVTEAQTVILPGSGVNLKHYALAPYPENETVRFLYLGRMMKDKGTDELLDAIKMLYDDCYEVRLDLVGTFEESYSEQMKVLEALGIVVYHGFQNDPRPCYAAADCVVMPSHHEGMNNVLLEAAATGRPVIASYIPGCREAVDEGRTGFTCRVQDKYGLYEAMKKVAAMSRSQREEMGLAGRRRMEELFDKQMVVEDTMNAIFRV